jgi:Transmembrane secretion effector
VIAGQIVGNELAGPAAGGWLFGLAAVLPFAVNAGTLGIAVLLLLTLPSIFQSAISPGCRESATSLAALRQDLSDGLKWLHRHSSIRDVTIAVGVIAAMDAAWFAVLVLYVTQILGDKPSLYGLLLATGAIGGIAVGGKPHITRRLGSWRSVLMAGLVMAASQIVLGLTDNVIIAAAMLSPSSASLALFNMTAITMRQRQVPDYLLGRITSLYRTSHKVQRHLARSAVARRRCCRNSGHHARRRCTCRRRHGIRSPGFGGYQKERTRQRRPTVKAGHVTKIALTNAPTAHLRSSHEPTQGLAPPACHSLQHRLP